MRYFAAAKNNLCSFAVVGLFAGVAVSTSVGSVATATTDVYTTICVDASSVTIATPLNDSTVTEGNITLTGSVSQANQIEVYIDESYDSTIPLTIGQAAYSSQMQVPTGTHTIRVEAVNSCGGVNGTASSVVTYTPPPSQPSVGSETPTVVGSAQQSDSPSAGVGSSGVGSVFSSLPIPQSIRTPLENSLHWLGVDVTPGQVATGGGRLTPVRAAIVTVSMTVLAFGVIPRARHAVAGSALAVKLLPGRTRASRLHVITWSMLVGAGFVLLLALFW